jgi:hypothetical protein
MKKGKVMDREEFLSRVKVEFRAFQHLLDRYKDPVRAYEVWKEECRFDVSSVLERLIFDELLDADEIKRELDRYCELIDEDLWWLEGGLDLGKFIEGEWYEE